MWWIIGPLLGICIMAFLFLFNHGADMKNKSNYEKTVVNDEQAKAVRRM